MDPLLPKHALPFFGPEPQGDWGGVPWAHAQAVTPGMYLPPRQQPWQNKLALFTEGIIIVTGNVDDDTDGPGGSTAVDPCWQPQTSLRWPDQSSVNSRTFRGMVMHAVVQLRGAKLGDFGLVCLGGVLHCVQYYDKGPTEKLQEGSEKTLRDTGVIDANQSSRHAATIGNDVQDFCALIFPGSAPRDQHGRPHAVEQDEMIARTLALWRKFTGRLAAAPDAGNSGTPALQPKSGAASGSVGLAVPFSLGTLTFALSTLMRLHVLATTPPLEIGVWLGCLAFVMSLINTGLSIREKLKPNPALDTQFVPRKEIVSMFESVNRQVGTIKESQEHDSKRYGENVRRLEKLDEKLDRNCKEISKEHEKMREDVRHDVRNEIDKLDKKQEERYEKQIDRLTDVIREQGKVEGKLSNTGGRS